MADARVKITTGIVLPLFPMRPRSGPDITKARINIILEEMESKKFVWQAKLNGDRAVLGVRDDRVMVCNRHGGWFGHTIANAGAFLKIGNGTVLDGEVFGRNFYPFEALAVEGRSFIWNTTEEREIIAMQMCRLAGVAWMYPRPTKAWLSQLSKNLPKYEGMVRKKADASYIPLGSASQTSSGWVKQRWG